MEKGRSSFWSRFLGRTSDAKAEKYTVPPPVHDDGIDSLVHSIRTALHGNISGIFGEYPWQIPAAYRCIEILGDASALCPLRVETSKGVPVASEGRSSDMNGMTALMWQRAFEPGTSPDGIHSGFEFIQQLVIDLFNRGNAFLTWAIEPKMPHLELLYPIGQIDGPGATLVRNADHWFFEDLNGKDRRIAPDRVIHIKVSRMRRPVSRTTVPMGIPPAYAVEGAFSVAGASERFIVESIGRANRSGITFNYPATLTEKQIKDRDALARAFAGGPHPMIVDSGGKIESTMSGTSGMITALSDLREFQVAEIARAYGVPLSLLNVSTSSWNANVEQALRLFYTTRLKAVWRRIAEALAFVLLPPGFTFRFDETEFLSGNLDVAAKLIPVLRMNPAQGMGELGTTNEQRRLAGLPKVADGDTLRREVPMPESRRK